MAEKQKQYGSMFQKAVKYGAKLRMCIAGPSGSGKTYTALRAGIALANGGKVALVDTEHRSASKYADIFDFDVLELGAPFHPNRFVEAIKDADEAGYTVVILDSLSHAWRGPGGMLDIVDEIATRMKTTNTFAAWKDATPIQNALVEAILAADLHVIATMRSKQSYVMERSDKGYTTVRKVGMAPVQREGFEYEFDVFLDMDIDNKAIVSKTRCPALVGKVFNKPGEDLAAILSEWLAGEAAPERPEPPEQPVDIAFTSQGAALAWACKKGAFSDAAQALKAYETIREKAKPKNATEMGTYWRANVAGLLKAEAEE